MEVVGKILVIVEFGIIVALALLCKTLADENSQLRNDIDLLRTRLLMIVQRYNFLLNDYQTFLKEEIDEKLHD